jgi:hypothetical protein
MHQRWEQWLAVNRSRKSPKYRIKGGDIAAILSNAIISKGGGTVVREI